MDSIGKRLKEYRKKAGLTQQAVADKANISRSHYASLESEKYKPSLDTLTNIANVFGVDVRLLMPTEEASNTVEELNDRDRKSIEKDLKEVMEDFKNGNAGPLFYEGVELDDEDLEKLEIAMRTALEIAKVKNKKKYTPKKYRK